MELEERTTKSSSTELESKLQKHHPFQSGDQALAPSSTHISEKNIPSMEVDKDDY